MRFFVFVAVCVGLLWWQHPEWFRLPGGGNEGGSEVVLYVIDGHCPACRDSEQLLAERGIAFERVTPDAGPDVERRYRADGGRGTVPLLVVAGTAAPDNERYATLGALAGHFGDAVYTPAERAALAPNFSADGQPQVVMYATAWCGYCTAARRWFDQNGIAFVERDIERDPGARADYDLLQGSGTPLIYVGHQRVRGFNQPRLAEVVRTL